MTTVMVVEDDPAFLTRFCRIVGADAELALFAAVGDLKVVQVIGAGGLLINPTEQDIESEIGPDIAANYRGAGVDAKSRIHLAKLAWDATGTQFGQRMLQYERYYAGDPVRVGASLYMRHDVGELIKLVERALSDDVMKV